MEEEKKCPKCGFVNPFTRVTCQACHEKLTRNVNPFLPLSEKEMDEPIVKEKPKAKRGRKPKIQPKPTELPTEPKKLPRKKRVVRRKRGSASEPILFSLQDGKLQAVRIIPFVLRAIKKKELKPQVQSILSLWNRNKNLFQK